MQIPETLSAIILRNYKLHYLNSIHIQFSNEFLILFLQKTDMVKRIILIGNGFDLAHDMPTSYKDFINNYWTNVNQELLNSQGNFTSDDFTISYLYRYITDGIYDVVNDSETYSSDFYKEFGRSNTNFADFNLLNHFLFQISKKSFENWVDIEDEYYKLLLTLIKDKNSESVGVERLNKELSSIKNHLQNYLTSVQSGFEHSEKIIHHIQAIFSRPFNLRDFSEESKKKLFKEKWEKFKHISLDYDPSSEAHFFIDPFDKYLYSKVNHAVYDENAFNDLIRIKQNEFFSAEVESPEVITFNYTSTEQLYNDEIDFNVTHIHGELNDEHNPLIFGYGDELDDSYSVIEKLQNNAFLDNMKSINYSKTNNYKHVLSVIESGLFQVYILGHSCGNSDRTLLNTIFEHDNCASIKIFYYQDSENTDKYLETYKNISRNFNDKAKLRDRVVNWRLSEPLVPFRLKMEVMEDFRNEKPV